MQGSVYAMQPELASCCRCDNSLSATPMFTPKHVQMGGDGFAHCRHIAYAELSSPRQAPGQCPSKQLSAQHLIPLRGLAPLMEQCWWLQACYGHTEGCAGITGALMAMAALTQAQAPGVMCLRNVNPYVGSALQEWSPHGAPLVPRQLAAGPAAAPDSLSGTNQS